MQVTVRYFASIREAIGVGSEVVQTDALDLGGLRDELLAVRDDLEAILAALDASEVEGGLAAVVVTKAHRRARRGRCGGIEGDLKGRRAAADSHAGLIHGVYGVQPAARIAGEGMRDPRGQHVTEMQPPGRAGSEARADGHGGQK